MAHDEDDDVTMADMMQAIKAQQDEMRQPVGFYWEAAEGAAGPQWFIHGLPVRFVNEPGIWLVSVGADSKEVLTRVTHPGKDRGR